MNGLGVFLQDELNRRAESPERFAKRSGLGVSHVYQIMRGEKTDLQFSTVERIAFGLGMTPAALMVAIGKGSAEEDPQRAPLHALIDQAPPENLGTLHSVVRAFVATTHAKGPLRRSAKTLRPKLNAPSNPDDSDADNTPTVWLRGLQGFLAPVVANS